MVFLPSAEFRSTAPSDFTSAVLEIIFGSSQEYITIRYYKEDGNAALCCTRLHCGRNGLWKRYNLFIGRLRLGFRLDCKASRSKDTSK